MMALKEEHCALHRALAIWLVAAAACTSPSAAAGPPEAARQIEAVAGEATAPSPGRRALASLAHLDWLRRPIRVAGKGTLVTWQIYAGPVRPGDRLGPFRFADAPGEGLGCVDDVARAAIVYLWHHEATGSPASLARALEALRFVRAMSAGDGTYFNFIASNGHINSTGSTSTPGLNWWTARAFWALAEGARVLARTEPVTAAVLRLNCQATVRALARDQRPSYGRFRGGLPAWLAAGAADVSSVFVLGLLALDRAGPSPLARELAARYAEGIVACERGSPDRYPYHAHLPSDAPGLWHAYGAHMLHALAAAGAALGRDDFLAAARREADHFTTHLIISGGPLESFSPAPVPYPQIAYGVSATGLGLLELARATGEPRYARMAALLASWLDGNNSAGVPMFDAASGRFWDGLDAKGPSENSGAESTIEGLLMLLQLTNSGHTPKPNWPGLPRTQPACTPANWVSACVPNYRPFFRARELVRAPFTGNGENDAPAVEYRVFSVGSGRVALVRNLAPAPGEVRLPGRAHPLLLPPAASVLVAY
jgi:hypothetical protein